MGPGMWLAMAAGTVAFWVVVALAVRALLGAGSQSLRAARSISRHDDLQPPQAEQVSAPAERQGPLAVLQDRLASGEIDVDEYARIRRALVQSQPSLADDATAAQRREDASQV